MGLKKVCKEMIMKRVMKKRKANTHFDEIASEHFELPEDAGVDMNNSYYFSAHSMDGTSMFFRLGKRGGGKDAVAEVWCALRLPDGTAYMNETQLFPLAQSPSAVKCITPLKEWEFSFDGKMVPVKPGDDMIAIPNGSAISANFTGTFTSESKIYESSRDTHVVAFARAIAAEKWEKGFSDGLKAAHQNHLEQEGHVKGVFKVGTKEHVIDSPALRDHSFGKRVWSYMNQHKWLSPILEDGTNINVNSVHYPALNVKGLKTGYKMEGDKTINVVDWVFDGDMTGGRFDVKYCNKTEDNCSFKLDIAFPFTFTDKDGSYTIFEGLSSFMINGKQGRGISEFGFNGDKTKYED